MEITVKFYGNLRKYGEQFTLKDVANTKEVMNALICQIKGLRATIQKGYFEIKKGDRNFTQDSIATDVFMPYENNEILHITPVIAGAGKGIMAIAGVVLIAVGAYFGQPYLIAMGAGLLASGVAQMLAPMPTMNEPDRDQHEKKQSTSFSNLNNLIAQGRPVPLAYGKILVGSLVIGKGVETRTEQLAINSEVVNGKWGLGR